MKMRLRTAAMRWRQVAVSVLIALCICQTSLAAGQDKSRYLSGCDPVGYEYKNGRLYLKPVKVEEYDQTVFFIHNVSMDRINLKSVKDNDYPHYPSWQAKIGENRWAAFATDREGIEFNCETQSYSNDGSTTNCESAIDVCQYTRAKFGPHIYGNFFVTTNKSKYSARNSVIRYGVLLRK